MTTDRSQRTGEGYRPARTTVGQADGEHGWKPVSTKPATPPPPPPTGDGGVSTKSK